MMKKIIALCLAVLMILSLAACGESAPKTAPTEAKRTTPVQTNQGPTKSQEDKIADLINGTPTTAGQSPTEAPAPSPTSSGSNGSYSHYDEGVYLIGTDLPAGVYVAYPNSTYRGFFNISTDADGEDTIVCDLFTGQTYIEVKDGQYLTLSLCYAVDVKDKFVLDLSATDVISEGQYLVGDDIPAGTYTATHTGSKDYHGYYCITTDANSENIVENDLFDDSTTFTVSNGQYLELTRCEIALK